MRLYFLDDSLSTKITEQSYTCKILIVTTTIYFMLLTIMLTLLCQISQDLMLDAISNWDFFSGNYTLD